MNTSKVNKTLSTIVLALSLGLYGCTVKQSDPHRMPEANNYDVQVTLKGTSSHIFIGRYERNWDYYAGNVLYADFSDFKDSLYFLNITQEGVRDSSLENLANRKSISKIYFAMKNRNMLPWLKGGIK